MLAAADLGRYLFIVPFPHTAIEASQSAIGFGRAIEHVLLQDKSKIGWSHITEDKSKALLHSIGNLCMLSQA